MEKVGETPIEEENPEKIVGKVIITVYNDCFSIEHTVGLSTEDIIGLFVNSLDKLTGSFEGTDEQTVH